MEESEIGILDIDTKFQQYLLLPCIITRGIFLEPTILPINNVEG
jgi:hypothetical protein